MGGGELRVERCAIRRGGVRFRALFFLISSFSFLLGWDCFVGGWLDGWMSVRNRRLMGLNDGAQ